jgi:hypothetical protein
MRYVHQRCRKRGLKSAVEQMAGDCSGRPFGFRPGRLGEHVRPPLQVVWFQRLDLMLEPTTVEPVRMKLAT